MKPQQPFIHMPMLGPTLRAYMRSARSSLPALMAIAVALASSVVLTLSGCVSSAGSSSTGESVAPVSLDVGTGASTPVAVPTGDGNSVTPR